MKEKEGRRGEGERGREREREGERGSLLFFFSSSSWSECGHVCHLLGWPFHSSKHLSGGCCESIFCVFTKSQAKTKREVPQVSLQLVG